MLIEISNATIQSEKFFCCKDAFIWYDAEWTTVFSADGRWRAITLFSKTPTSTRRTSRNRSKPTGSPSRMSTTPNSSRWSSSSFDPSFFHCLFTVFRFVLYFFMKTVNGSNNSPHNPVVHYIQIALHWSSIQNSTCFLYISWIGSSLLFVRHLVSWMNLSEWSLPISSLLHRISIWNKMHTFAFLSIIFGVFLL